MKIILYSRPSASISAEMFDKLIESIAERGLEYKLNRPMAEWVTSKGSAAAAKSAVYDTLADTDAADSVVISYGGDGTMLEAVRAVGGAHIPVLGINSGRLGFLSTVSKSELASALDALVGGDYTIEQRALLHIEGDFGDKVAFPYALNEFSIQRQHMGMIGIKVEIDGRSAVNYWSDGALVATPTGSTAYSLSAGGPIVTPECKCMILTPIAPHNLTMRPIVVPDDSTVRLTVEARNPYALAGIDNENFRVADGASFVVTKADKHVFLVRLQNISFCDTLKNKMMWGLDGRDATCK